jgi:hypothetical protein
MIIDHSVLFACIVGALFFLTFFAGSVALGREKAQVNGH